MNSLEERIERLEKYIKQAYEQAIERGEFTCKGKHDEGGDYCEYHCDKEDNCDYIDPNKNISELLMNIVIELSKAVEAWEKVADLEWLEAWANGINSIWKEEYITFIKPTREHHLAGAFIRLFELCGYKNVYLEDDEYISNSNNRNVSCELLEATKLICNQEYIIAFPMLIDFCNYHNIEIEKHIEARLAYDRSINP